MFKYIDLAVGFHSNSKTVKIASFYVEITSINISDYLTFNLMTNINYTFKL